MKAAHIHHQHVRSTDCDPYGHLATANYLRVLLEADSAAMRKAGADLEVLAEHGIEWRARNAYIEFLTPLVAGDLVTVKTGLIEVSGDTSSSGYTLYKDGSDKPAARGSIDWFTAALGSSEPVPIPDETRRALQRELPASDDQTASPPAPTLPPQPPGVFRMSRRVEWRDLDSSYRFSCGAAADLLMDCSIRVGETYGWSVQQSQQRGIGYVARRLWIEFQTRASLGDALAVSTWVSPPKRSTITRHYQIQCKNDQEMIAAAHILWVCVDVTTGRPMRHPKEWRNGFENQVSEISS